MLVFLADKCKHFFGHERLEISAVLPQALAVGASNPAAEMAAICA